MRDLLYRFVLWLSGFLNSKEVAQLKFDLPKTNTTSALPLCPLATRPKLKSIKGLKKILNGKLDIDENRAVLNYVDLAIESERNNLCDYLKSIEASGATIDHIRMHLKAYRDKTISACYSITPEDLLDDEQD